MPNRLDNPGGIQRVARFLACLALIPALAQPAYAAPISLDVAKLKSLATTTSAFLDALPRDTFDPGALLAELADKSPDALLRAVKERTVPALYRGALRGAHGTLMDGSGNALDRSLLLGELLRLAGFTVRLVAGRLPETAGQRLLAAALGVLVTGRQSTDDHFAELAAASAGGSAQVEQALRQFYGGLLSEAERVKSLVETQSQTIATTVGLSTARAERPDLADIARDHWWIEVSGADGSWQVLDPSGADLTDVKRGMVYEIAPDRRIEASLPETLFQRVRFSVKIEQWQSGALTEHEVMVIGLLPALSLDVPVTLRFMPADQALLGSVVGSDDPLGLLLASLPDVQRWTPFATVGEQVVSGKPFDLSGVPIADQQSDGGGGGLGGIFGEITEALDPSYLTGLTIDYTVQAPSTPDETIRRQLFDAFGPGLRAAGTPGEPAFDDAGMRARAFSLASATEIALVPGAISPQLVTALAASELRAVARVGLALAGEPAGSDSRTAYFGLRSLAPQSLALARQLWSPSVGGLAIGTVDILTSHAQLADIDGKMAQTMSYDIVRNATGSGQAPVDEMRQGVADTIAEASILTAQSLGTNASLRFANAGGVSWVLARLDASLEMFADADLRAQIETARNQGAVALAPTADHGDQAAWWRIDPVTGTTLGMSARGWGEDTVEYTILLGEDTMAEIAPPVVENVPAEGVTEYLIVLGFIMICSVVSLGNMISESFNDWREKRGICLPSA